MKVRKIGAHLSSREFVFTVDVIRVRTGDVKTHRARFHRMDTPSNVTLPLGNGLMVWVCPAVGRGAAVTLPALVSLPLPFELENPQLRLA